MTIVTTAMVKEIRLLRRRGLTLAKIARRVGVCPGTVWKYLSDANEEWVRLRDANTWQKIKSDAAKLEKRRAAVRDWKRGRKG